MDIIEEEGKKIAGDGVCVLLRTFHYMRDLSLESMLPITV